MGLLAGGKYLIRVKRATINEDVDKEDQFPFIEDATRQGLFYVNLLEVTMIQGGNTSVSCMGKFTVPLQSPIFKSSSLIGFGSSFTSAVSTPRVAVIPEELGTFPNACGREKTTLERFPDVL